MSIIYKYSPFHNEEDLFKQFDLIKGSHGTLICIYNVKLLDNGDPELGEEIFFQKNKLALLVILPYLGLHVEWRLRFFVYFFQT